MAEPATPAGPRLGSHMSVAGGHHNALTRGRDVGADVVQIFSKNANQWRAKPLADEDIARFHQTREETGYAPEVLVVHDSYLINLATPDDALWQRSQEAFGIELDRAQALGIPYLVTHAGAHMGQGEEAGLARIAAAIDQVVAERPDGPLILLETTAGQGTSLCYRFEHIARVIELTHHADRIGICLDTCHVFAAGYDLSTPEGYDSTVTEFDRLIGLDRLKVIHVNDSKKGLGSRVDRHEHIGQGAIGLEGFRLLLNDPRVNSRPMVLETEKGPEGKEDRMNLATLRGLIR